MKFFCAQHVQVRRNVLKWLCRRDMSGNEFSLWTSSGTGMFCLHMYTHPRCLLHYSVCVCSSPRHCKESELLSLLGLNSNSPKDLKFLYYSLLNFTGTAYEIAEKESRKGLRILHRICIEKGRSNLPLFWYRD